MKEIACTIYDCEFDLYHKGVIKDNVVYKLDNEGNPVPIKEYVCEYVDFDRVQFYTGYYDRTYSEPQKDNSKWGYFQLSTGSVIVPPIYDYACPFYGDRARVYKNKKYGFIDTEGSEVVEVLWDNTAGAFHEALCWVRKGDKFGYIDKRGRVILSPQFDIAKEFEFIGNDYEGHKYAALVKKDGKYGYIDEKGKYIFEPSFDDAKKFWSKGYAPVKAYGKWAFIDKSGEFVVAFQFHEVGEEGRFEINEYLENQKTLSSELYIDFYTVNKDGQWGLMDSNFNIIMPEPGANYVIYKGIKLFIKEGRVTSKRKVPLNKSEKEQI